MLKNADFVDIKELASKKIKNRTRNTDGGIVNWLKHRILSEGFMKLVVSSQRGRRRRPETTTRQQLYMRRLVISEEKKRDLMSLLSSRVIPPEYKQYYDGLPSSGRVAAVAEEDPE